MSAYGEVEAYLRRRIPELLAVPVQQISVVSSGVWRVLTIDGQELIAKYQIFAPLTQGREYDLLKVEREVLVLLQRAKCPVPQWLGVDEEAFFVFYQSVGHHTLDDVVQAGNERCAALTAQIISGQCAIDVALDVSHLAACVAPGVDKPSLMASWQWVGERAQQGAKALLLHLGAEPLTARHSEVLAEMHAWLAARPPVLGSSDYNARNIVIDASVRRAFFIEFAKLGWDWTERRLVQYTTCMGSGRADGAMRVLLDAEGARLYAEESGRADGAKALDYQQIFFMLNGAAALCAALADPMQDSSKALLRAWSAPQARLRQFAKALAQPLSSNEVSAEWRTIFATALHETA